MALTIDNLEIQIETNANNAKKGINALANTLSKLKSAVGDTSGLANNLKGISDAIQTFSGVGKINLTAKATNIAPFVAII